MDGLVAGAAPAIAGDADFFTRVRARLTLEVPPALTDPGVPAVRGDLDLDPSLWERAGVAATRPAAVLVGVVDRSEPTVLLTQRNAALGNHAGQIAFPGGKIELGDASPVAAALREAQEEIGLAQGAGRADRISRPLPDLQRLSGSPHGWSRRSGAHARAQSSGG